MSDATVAEAPAIAERSSVSPPQQNSDEEEAGVTQSCEMCANYEANLSKLQETQRDLTEQLTAAKELATRYEKELSGERLYRKELESKLSVLSSDTEKQVNGVAETTKELEARIESLVSQQHTAVEAMRTELQHSRHEYGSLQEDMTAINQRYQRLLGLNRQKANEMREQSIELPQDVDQLQFLCLQLREELIETRAAYEHSDAELKDELAAVRENLREAQLTLLQHQNEEEVVEALAHYREKAERYEAAFRPMKAKIAELEESLNQYRQKCTTLQNELDTSTSVQKDFVQLSQSLQIQLEKIRQAEHEVRWQFDEDVTKCNRQNCETDVSGRKPKGHCLHCGKIFCRDCLSHSIPSGPNHRPAKVCDVCHTLLNRESAPFFSKGAGEAAQQ